MRQGEGQEEEGRQGQEEVAARRRSGHTARASGARGLASVRRMPHERRSTPLLCGRAYVRAELPADDEAIAQLATRQHGVVARRQLLAIGLGKSSIEHRLATGRLRRVFPGTYGVGHDVLAPRGRVCAGVLASMSRIPLEGPPRVGASHMSSAALRGIADAHPSAVHVSSPTFRNAQPGLVAHRAVLPPDELECVDGIPATSVARTLLDLSASVDRRFLRRLMKRAEFLSLVRASDLLEILERYPRRKGRRTLAALVADGTATSGRTRSDLEDEFLAFCRRRGLSPPDTNQVLHLRVSASRWIASGLTRASPSSSMAGVPMVAVRRLKPTAPATGRWP